MAEIVWELIWRLAVIVIVAVVALKLIALGMTGDSRLFPRD
jgi:hypothetical protein